MPKAGRLLAAAAAVVVLLFPVIVYFGLERLGPRLLALVLGAVFLARLALLLKAAPRQGARALGIGAAAVGCVLTGGTWALQSSGLLLFYPVFINLLFLAVFAASLVNPPSVIERLARLREPDLPEQGVRYTRKVTAVWCAFFLCNGAIALATVLAGDMAVWALYNGCLAYVAMGGLFAGEWLIRRRVMVRVAA